MERPATALAERFGLGIRLAGPLLNTAAATHLAASSSAADARVARWSVGGLHTIGTRVEQQQSSTGCKPASAFAWSADDLQLYELGSRGKQLVARATGSGGRTVDASLAYFNASFRQTGKLKRQLSETN